MVERPCDPAATIRAAPRVLRASGPVPRQNGGYSSYAAVTVAENSGGSAVAVPGLRMLCSTVDTKSASARETFGRISGFLSEWVDSASEVASRLALLHGRARRRPRQWHVFYLFLLVMTHLALCSRRLLAEWRSVHSRCFDYRAVFFLENMDIISTSPSAFCSLSAVGRLRYVVFLEPSTTKSSSLSRAPLPIHDCGDVDIRAS